MKSVWSANSELPEFSRLDGDIDVDVLIIGGGLAGLLTAYFLHQRDVNYALVEKDRICNGVTKNTTAKITFQHGLIYQKVLKYYGLETAQMYLKANKEAFEIYRQLCKGIDCDFEIKDNFVYSVSDINKLEEEIKDLNAILESITSYSCHL